jgi:hypothetical protein
MTLLCPAGRWRGDTEGGPGRTGDEVHGADAVFVVGFGRKYLEGKSRVEKQSEIALQYIIYPLESCSCDQK